MVTLLMNEFKKMALLCEKLGLHFKQQCFAGKYPVKPSALTIRYLTVLDNVQDLDLEQVSEGGVSWWPVGR